jgi:hypothetical protein
MPSSLVEQESLAGAILPESATTINSWIQTQVKLNEPGIRQMLKTSVSKIHVMADLWNTRYHKHVMGIIFRFVLPGGEVTKVVAGLPQVKGQHRGQNFAPVMHKVLEYWGVTTRVGYFTMDNDSKLDIILQHLSVKDNIPPTFNVKWRRIRCQGHVLNLSANAFANPGDDDGAIPERSSNARNNEEERGKHFKKGCIGWLSRFNAHIRGGGQRYENFQTLSGGLAIPKDNSTRWNSYFLRLRGHSLSSTLSSSTSGFMRSQMTVLSP